MERSRTSLAAESANIVWARVLDTSPLYSKVCSHSIRSLSRFFHLAVSKQQYRHVYLTAAAAARLAKEPPAPTPMPTHKTPPTRMVFRALRAAPYQAPPRVPHAYGLKYSPLASARRRSGGFCTLRATRRARPRGTASARVAGSGDQGSIYGPAKRGRRLRHRPKRSVTAEARDPAAA